MTNKFIERAMKSFAKASYELKYEIFRELEQDEDRTFSAFIKEYPFEVPFDEINQKIQKWVESAINET